MKRVVDQKGAPNPFGDEVGFYGHLVKKTRKAARRNAD